MRKKTVSHLADTVFWYLLYFLPVIVYLLYCIAEPNTGANFLPMEQFFDSVGFNVSSENVIYTSLQGIFGAEGVLPLFNGTLPFYILTWFSSVYLCHICVDFVLWLPRLAHKFMNKFTREEC